MKLSEVTDKLLDHIFAHLDVKNLDEWNSKFFESTRTWWKAKRKLSDKQKTRLADLWEKQLGNSK
jgi:hypothetical protein